MIKNTVILLVAIILGSVANMLFIMLSAQVIPPPAGVDVKDIESIRQSMHLYETKHFIPPLLAHAIGSFVGAFIVAKFASNHQFTFAMFIGALFLAGGISMAFQLPAPTWFTIVDIICAYIPMAWFGYRLATKEE